MSVAGFALAFAAGLVAGWLLKTFLAWRQQQCQQRPGPVLPVPFPPPEVLVQAVKDEQLVLLAGTGLVANLCPKPVWLPAHTRELADVQNASRSWEGLYQALFGTIKRQYGPDFSAEIDKLLMDPAGETDLLSHLLHQSKFSQSHRAELYTDSGMQGLIMQQHRRCC